MGYGLRVAGYKLKMKWNNIIGMIGVILIVIIIVATILNLRSKVAIAVPPFFTYIKKGYRDNAHVLAHEKCHEDQYSRMGFFKFYGQYFVEQFGGYNNSSLEKECYQIENLKK